MALSDRLGDSSRRRQNRGCVTCQWAQTISKQDRDSIQAWLNNGWSMAQLHQILATDPDNPLTVGLTAFKNHINGCAK